MDKTKHCIGDGEWETRHIQQGGKIEDSQDFCHSLLYRTTIAFNEIPVAQTMPCFMASNSHRELAFFCRMLAKNVWGLLILATYLQLLGHTRLQHKRKAGKIHILELSVSV